MSDEKETTDRLWDAAIAYAQAEDMADRGDLVESDLNSATADLLSAARKSWHAFLTDVSDRAQSPKPKA